MAIYEDLTEYVYRPEAVRPGTRNVGWLGKTSIFRLASHPDEILELVWEVCGISIAQTRGLHICPFCRRHSANRARRNSESLLLGSSEIRVFSNAGYIYAAPTLIYHYIAMHHYCPPEEFLAALKEGLAPSRVEYFSRLQALDLDWNRTSTPSMDEGAYRFVKLADDTVMKVRVDDEVEEADLK